MIIIIIIIITMMMMMLQWHLYETARIANLQSDVIWT